MNTLVRFLFFTCVVRPLCLIVLGLNIRHRERLPQEGPGIVVANHNSHLDALALMTMMPRKVFTLLRPVAAADYFLSSPIKKWFSLEVLRIIPVARRPKRSDGDPLQGISDALRNGDIVILFPEGSRGEPEQLAEFKRGIHHLAERHPDVPICPIFMHGLGKALPRGEGVLVPFFCDVFVGEPIEYCADRDEFMATLVTRMGELAAEGSFPPWE